MRQPSLFDDFDLVPTPAMRAGRSTVWFCQWCGSILAHPKAVKPTGVCPSCGVADHGWSFVEVNRDGHYTGPFYRREQAEDGDA